MILVRFQGGLGNQLFQYAAGWSLAEDRQDRLIADLSWFAGHPERPYLLPGLGLRPRRASLADRLAAGWLPSPRWQSRLQRLARKVLPERATPWRCDADDPLRILHDRRRVLVLDGYWQDQRLFAAHAERLRRHLAVRCTAVHRRRMHDFDVAIHVRRGDYASDPAVAATMGCLDTAYYETAIIRLGPWPRPPRVVCFSDDAAGLRASWHPPFELIFPQAEPADPVEDLLLMAAASDLVIANSTFSWWAAWIGERPGRRIVAPRRWSRDPALRIQPGIPGHWLRV